MQRQGELVDLREYDPALAIEPVSDMMIGTVPGAVLSFTAREGHFQFREWWAVALLDRVSYVQIIYHTSALNAAVGARLQRILSSVSLGENTPQRTVGGFARRRAGRISLDVPERLIPPSAFSFASSEGDVRLGIRIYEHRTVWKFPSGKILDQFAEAVETDDMPISIMSFAMIRDVAGKEERWSYRHSQIVFDDGVAVHVDGDAPSERSAILHAAFRRVVASVQQE